MSQPEQWDISTSVGLTALGVAAARAIESSRPDRLIEDPYASAFLRAVDSPIPPDLRWPEHPERATEPEAILIRTSLYMGVRTRFFDEYLIAAAQDVGQVVIVAAGLDTRAYRLDWPPGLRLYELDQPGVLHFKDAVLAGLDAKPRAERIPVPTDLRGDWPAALRGAGFDPAVPTAWQAEGLLPYLPAEAEQRLFRVIDELSAPGSRIGVERTVDLSGMLDRDGLGQVRDEATGWQFATLVNAEDRSDPAEWLSARGWVTAVELAPAVAQRYGRELEDARLSPMPGPSMRLGGHSMFLTARHA